MVARNVSRTGAALLVAGALAVGCSHAWDVLEPLPGSTGTTGGGASASSTGGLGGAGGAGGAPSTSSSATSSAQGSGGAASSSSAESSSAANSSSSAESSSSAASSSASTGGGSSTAYYGATLAACNSDMNLDTAACEQPFGNGSMTIDAMNDAGQVSRGFVRFDLDSTLVGKTIDSVTLRLTTLPDNDADSNSSGQISRVMPFTAASLLTAQPATIGAPVGAAFGPIAFATDYFWALPKSLVAPSAPVFLGIETTSVNGVRYWNDHGTVPPLLTVTYH